jgi:hypothetical protein
MDNHEENNEEDSTSLIENGIFDGEGELFLQPLPPLVERDISDDERESQRPSRAVTIPKSSNSDSSVPQAMGNKLKHRSQRTPQAPTRSLLVNQRDVSHPSTDPRSVPKPRIITRDPQSNTPVPVPRSSSLPQRSRFQWMISKLWYYLKLFLFAVTVVACYHAFMVSKFDVNSLIFAKEEVKASFVPAKLINYMPAVNCYPVSKEEFLHMKTDPKWKHVVDSMLHYMNTEDIDSISSFHVGHASCFMMLRQEDKSILQMYNPNFKGYYSNVFVRVNEVSMMCPQINRVIERANTIIMSYNEAENWELVIERFNYTQAWTAQATGFYLKGKTICEIGKVNTDYGRPTLEEAIGGYK